MNERESNYQELEGHRANSKKSQIPVLLESLWSGLTWMEATPNSPSIKIGRIDMCPPFYPKTSYCAVSGTDRAADTD